MISGWVVQGRISAVLLNIVFIFIIILLLKKIDRSNLITTRLRNGTCRYLDRGYHNEVENYSHDQCKWYQL